MTVKAVSVLRSDDAVAKVLGDHVPQTSPYYKRVEELVTYETRKVEVKRDTHQQCLSYVEEKVRGWKAAHGPEAEEAAWGWHPLYHYVTSPLVLSHMPPQPWEHLKEEAWIIVGRLGEKRMSACTPPTKAHLLQLHMLCTKNAISAVDPNHGPTEEAIREWSQDVDLLVVSMRLLEALGSIVSADEPCWPSIDAPERIAFAQRRLLSGNLAMLEGWVHVVCARAMEDYAKVNETLFVEAW